MKKFARTLCMLMLVAVLGASCFALTACPGKTQAGENNERTPLIFSVQELDNVFNPFFATSAYDIDIEGNTQISFLSASSDGKPYCGKEEPSVALDYNQVIYYRAPGQKDLTAYEDGKAPTDVDYENTDADDYFTRYQFLIKNHIKFSDGVDLTPYDVLFNLYTYLDPAYYGSSTIYSTAIKGLLDYRTQTKDADDKTASAMDNYVNTQVNDRLRLLRYSYPLDKEKRESNRASNSADEMKQLYEDVKTVRKLFWDEIASDYDDAAAELESYEEQNSDPKNDDKELGFTEVWEIFLYNEGFITASTEADGTISEVKVANQYKDKNGNFIPVGGKQIDYANTGSWWHDKESLIRIVFNERMGIGSHIGKNYQENKDHKVDAKEEGEPASPVEGFGPTTDMLVDEFGKASGSCMEQGCDIDGKPAATDAEKAKNIADYNDYLLKSDSINNNLYNIVTFWATASNVRDQFKGEATQAYFTGKDQGIKDIEGIKLLRLEKGDIFKGAMRGSKEVEETSYVLQIDIEKVDPKAIWNFAFIVAPMHYYSNSDNDTTGKFNKTQDYRNFYYPIYKPSTSGESATGEFITDDPLYKNENHTSTTRTADEAPYLGRPFGNKEYLDNVLKSTKIISVPVGAGMYQVSAINIQDEYYLFNEDHKTLNPDAERPTFTEFCNNNIVYLIRNPFFYTTSGEGLSEEESSINNCLIKYIRYQVIASTKLLDAILNGQVHFGDPNATQENINRLNANSKTHGYSKVENNGYGYIGINATYVPDIEIRRAIMTAMDISKVLAFYQEGTASLIYRPMSTVSWASPQNKNSDFYKVPEYQKPYYYDNRYKADTEEGREEIKNRVKTAMQTGNGKTKYEPDKDGVYYRILEDGTKHRLEYTFTIAGATDAHPAYATMKEAAEILNECGFKCTVKTDANALSKLAAGTLAVWAAAWGSTIDPDMYQVYHKNSTATSVNNWGYPTILNGNPTTFAEDRKIIDQLSEKIDEARTMLDTKERARIYADALDLVMDLAVELPTYQRVNLYAYNTTLIDERSFNKDPNSIRGLTAQMWKVSLK